VTKRAHLDGEQKLTPDAIRALQAWLDAKGLRRVALAEPLRANQMQLSRVFAGTGYLSATQRRALEQFTQGALTVAMLEGTAKPPARVEPKREPISLPTARVPPTEEASAPRPKTTDEAERLVDDLAAKAMPAAFKVILQQMVQAKSESERRRCAEILIEHLRGKAKQYEKREALIQPVSDEALLRKLTEIEANLHGAETEQP
jgi:hypothetical protein